MDAKTAAATLAAATPAEIDAAWIDAETSAEDAGYRAVRAEKFGQDASAYRAAEATAKAEVAVLAAVYAHRGGWTRAYAVPGGHIHRSTACSTCHLTTKFALLPQVSGMDEEQIVDAAGERACTVCYPTAPVAPKPCTLWTKDEEAARADAAARQAATAAKKAKQAAAAITAADGTPLKDSHGFVIKTERTAEIEVVDLIANHEAYGYREHLDVQAAIVEALAAKRGTTVEEQRALVAAKAAKKVAAARREMARY